MSTVIGTNDPVDTVTTTRYAKPPLNGKKEYAKMGKTAFGSLTIQVMNEGGENNLHSHVNDEGFWYVLSGRARFYTTDDLLVAEIGPGEGFVTPRGYKYWFESVPGEDLELMRFGVSMVNKIQFPQANARVNHDALKPNQFELLERKDSLVFEMDNAS